MSYENHDVLVVIPARAGSKRIPKKNLQPLLGRSLLERAVAFAEGLPYVDHIVVSTDSPEIVTQFPTYGLLTQGPHLHSDGCSGMEIWKHAWSSFGEYPISLYLEPSSPLREERDVLDCLGMLFDHSAAATVSLLPAKFRPEKLIVNQGVETIRFYSQEETKGQALPTYYVRNGCCYAARGIATMRDFYADCARVLTEHPVVNIDDWLDFQVAEWILGKNIQRGGG